MKREIFTITCNDVKVIKHKWNKAIDETERMIRHIALNEKTVYKLIDSQSTKDGFYHVSGYRTWQGDNGNIVKFDINKVY